MIEAAEKAAAGIIDDAEAQARTYLEESRRRADLITDQRAREVASMTDALIECAEAAKRQSDQLLAVLGQTRVRVDEAVQVHLPEKPTPSPAGLDAAAFALSQARHEPAQAASAPPQPPAAAPPAPEPPQAPPPFVSAPPPAPAAPPQAAPPAEFPSAPPEPQPPAGPPGSVREEPPVGTQWWTLKDSSRPGA